MKKILVMAMVMMLVCSGAILAAEGYFNAKLGFDFGGEQEWTFDDGSSTDFDTDSGVTIAAEYVVPYSETVDFGAGIAYQFNRGIDETGVSDDVEFNFVPLYGLVKYNVDTVYLVGQLGYNFFNGSDEYKFGADEINLEGGLYYGLGAGVNFSSNMFGEILYSVSNGKITEDGYPDEIDVRNSQVSLMLGYTF